MMSPLPARDPRPVAQEQPADRRVEPNSDGDLLEQSEPEEDENRRQHLHVLRAGLVRLCVWATVVFILFFTTG